MIVLFLLLLIGESMMDQLNEYDSMFHQENLLIELDPHLENWIEMEFIDKLIYLYYELIRVIGLYYPIHLVIDELFDLKK
jgi:hypothetical protein